MVTERWDSREQDITKDGDNIVQILTLTWSEWSAGMWVPAIGDSWSSSRPDLVATHINCKPLNQNYCTVTITFSTQNAEAREERENQITSWREEIDFGVTEASLGYWTDTSAAEHIWRDIWTKQPTNGYGQSEETLDTSYPVVKTPSVNMSITTYGDAWYINRILTYLTTVNSNYFLQYISSIKSSAEAYYNDDVGSFDDTGKWMLVGCRVERIRNNCWRYDWEFEFNANGWNYWPMPAASGMSSPYDLKYYSTADFSNLFVGMNLNEPSTDPIGNT